MKDLHPLRLPVSPHVTRIALALALLLAGGAAAAAGPDAPDSAPASADSTTARAGKGAKHHDGWNLDARVLGYGGGFDGYGVRRVSGGLLGAEAALVPELRAGEWKLAVPLELAHRQTLGASLSETSGHVAVEPTYRISRALDLCAEAGLSGAWRPDWPDLYQRDATGYMPGTERYSYLSWRVGASLHARPFDRQHLRLHYRYVSTTYERDPAFDPGAPMHLTPRDNGQHRIDLSWRVLGEGYARGDGYAAGVRFGYDHRQDFTLLARDAGTGFSSGNPLQRLDRAEPAVDVELKRLEGRLEARLEYGYQIQNDPFQAYYSYQGHHPTLVIAYAFDEALSARARLEGWFHTYGPDSKANTADGKRLHDDKALVKGELRYALRDGLSLVAEGEWIWRDTNYPDYVPGVYPATRFYDIRWSYDNLRTIAGVEWRR
ncbi:hypothetical protein [Anaeromyxobacter oryzisoli]|uniref:hypothetical protein n=1 Tax=Anaeromyxobacter oryzisoli TaxID=2925408 RepID=UPI001F57D549|nr:hypothetical protein [Anaeromyxobacter sp. SG63]